jgi:hypothetical protein
MKALRWGFYLLLLVPLLAACDSRGTGMSVVPNPDGTFNITVSIGEADLNATFVQLLQTQLSRGEIDVQVRNLNVDLQPNRMVVTGTFVQQGEAMDVNVVLGVTARNGEITARILTADVQGLGTVDDEILASVNSLLDIQLRVLGEADLLDIRDVQINDTQMNVVVRAETNLVGGGGIFMPRFP